MSRREPLRQEQIVPARDPGQEPRDVKERRQPSAGTEAEAKEQGQPRTRAEPEGQPFRFDDPYWDEAFDSYYDPTLRTCCRI